MTVLLVGMFACGAPSAIAPAAESATHRAYDPAETGGPASPPPVGDDALWETTASGLSSTVLSPGTGERPTAGSLVDVHYTGWLQKQGTKFDSSLDRGEPFNFPLGAGKVIKGWDEGVALMQEGEKRRLLIPASLGYGEHGTGPIPGGATLIFDVELVHVIKLIEPPANPPALALDALIDSTASGLEYVVFEPGTGAQAVAGQTVSVHYTGWVQSTGALFDSSLKRGKPLSFKLGTGRVIPGWEEGIALMRVGGKSRLIIPGDLAYGARGRPGRIPPNATLIFDVELVDAN